MVGRIEDGRTVSITCGEPSAHAWSRFRRISALGDDYNFQILEFFISPSISSTTCDSSSR